MKLFFTLLFSVSIGTFSFSQNNGFFGKKTFIEFNGTAHSPVFKNMFSDSYMGSYQRFGSSLVEKNDRFNYGFSISIGRALKRNFAVAFEFGNSYASIKTPNYVWFERNYDGYWYDYNEVSFRHELIDIQTKTFMPKIEFTSEDGLLPVGFNNQIGIGFTSTSIVEKDYLMKVTYSDSALTNEEMSKLTDKFMDFDRTYKGFVFLYAFNIRTPISKSFMINYGMRYTLSLRRFFGVSGYSSYDYVYDNSEVSRQIGKTRAWNFINLNLGLTYVF